MVLAKTESTNCCILILGMDMGFVLLRDGDSTKVGGTLD
jgi:hypothetical protein